MNFLIITHVNHKTQDGLYHAYAPYVLEMNLWIKHVEAVEIVAPFADLKKTSIDIPYRHDNLILNEIPEIAFNTLFNALRSIFKIPVILFAIFKACKRADHIHLRCPGNIGLLGSFVQILFPKKIKTAKYAGNWNPNARQPLSYKIQKWLLSNTFLTKNIQVLVYGNWPNQTNNVKSFFTASYSNSEIVAYKERNYHRKLRFVFVGSLVKGKRPLLAIKTIEGLSKQDYNVQLEIYGEGVLKMELEKYILENNLEKVISLHGNQPKDLVKEALRKSHFLVLPSKSEGWPKVIAEAMFFGAIPIATAISCVPYMLDYGNRGILISAKLEDVVAKIENELMNVEALKLKSKKASIWSQNYTLDKFETEIAKLLYNK
jgi:glycosyltransferase involved in cell wall biosynthesis